MEKNYIFKLQRARFWKCEPSSIKTLKKELGQGYGYPPEKKWLTFDSRVLCPYCMSVMDVLDDDPRETIWICPSMCEEDFMYLY